MRNAGAPPTSWAATAPTAPCARAPVSPSKAEAIQRPSCSATSRPTGRSNLARSTRSRATSVAMFFPLGSPATWRVIAMDARESGTRSDGSTPDGSPTGPLTLEELQHALIGPTAGSVIVRDAVWLSRFRLHHRQVAHYRARARLPRRRRRAHPQPGRCAGHEHRHPGRLEPRLEARSRRAGRGERAAPRVVRGGALAGRSDPSPVHRPGLFHLHPCNLRRTPGVLGACGAGPAGAPASARVLVATPSRLSVRVRARYPLSAQPGGQRRPAAATRRPARRRSASGCSRDDRRSVDRPPA